MTATRFPNKTDADCAILDWSDDHPNAHAAPWDNGRAGCLIALVKKPERRNTRPWRATPPDKERPYEPDRPRRPGNLPPNLEVRDPRGTDLSTVVQALQSPGCVFNPEEDQLGLGQDTGAYARSSQRQSMKDALEEACGLENISLPENPPAWSELTLEQRQRILDWFGESLQWAATPAAWPNIPTS